MLAFYSELKGKDEPGLDASPPATLPVPAAQAAAFRLSWSSA